MSGRPQGQRPRLAFDSVPRPDLQLQCAADVGPLARCLRTRGRRSRRRPSTSARREHVRFGRADWAPTLSHEGTISGQRPPRSSLGITAAERVSGHQRVTALRPRYRSFATSKRSPTRRGFHNVNGASTLKGPNSRRQSIALAAAGCALAIAACGASNKGPAVTGSSSSVQAVAYAACMRSHGVQNFPDARSGGGFEIPSTINTQSPTYGSARRACANLQPGPLAAPTASERQRLQLVASAKCMRRHGMKVADPTFHGPYITLDVPDQTTIQSPAFTLADKACGYPIPKQ
jgi:hypothetical protein